MCLERVLLLLQLACFCLSSLLASLSVLADLLSDLFSSPQRLAPHQAAWQPLRLLILPTFKHLKCGSCPTVSTQQILPPLLRRQVQENKSRSLDLHPPVGHRASLTYTRLSYTTNEISAPLFTLRKEILLLVFLAPPSCCNGRHGLLQPFWLELIRFQ